jgi:hypothetical protein
MPGKSRKISKDSIRRSRELPTTGNGKDSGQKPKLSETNLQGNKQGWVAKLFTRRSQPGKHSSN